MRIRPQSVSRAWHLLMGLVISFSDPTQIGLSRPTRARTHTHTYTHAQTDVVLFG